MSELVADRIEEIFSQAIRQPTKSKRDVFIVTSCRNETALRTRIEILLRAHDRAGAFLETPITELNDTQSVLNEEFSLHVDSRPAAPIDIQSILDPSEQPDELGAFHGYGIVELLGRGGAGIVLKARDRQLNRLVAIKVLAPELASQPRARTRFLREARAAAAVRHEHVIDIFTINESATLPFLVMEYIAGRSLHERILQSGPLDFAEILRIGRDVAAGLAAAHAKRLVHRDVKPANILIDDDTGHVRITDFGLARAVDDIGITQDGVIAGTPQFMSPEQAKGQPLDYHTDLFSLGSVMFAMCAGRAPFTAESNMAVMKQICDEPVPPIHQQRPETPASLAELIDQLLEKDPAARPQTAAEVAERLAETLREWEAGDKPKATTATRRLKRPARFGSRTGWIVGGIATVAVALLFSFKMFSVGPWGRNDSTATDDANANVSANANANANANKRSTKKSTGSSTVKNDKSQSSTLPKAAAVPPTKSRIVAVNGWATDSNRDGTFDLIRASGPDLSVTRPRDIGTSRREVTLFEFDARPYRNHEIVDAVLEFRIWLMNTNPKSPNAELRVEAYRADGQITLDDATAEGVSAGPLTTLPRKGSLRIWRVPLDPVEIQKLIAANGRVGLRLSLSSGDHITIASRDTYFKNSAPTLEIQTRPRR